MWHLGLGALSFVGVCDHVARWGMGWGTVGTGGSAVSIVRNATDAGRSAVVGTGRSTVPV